MVELIDMPVRVSIRKSLLKPNGGDFKQLYKASTRLEHECLKSNRSRNATHSCHKDKKSYRTWRRESMKEQVLANITMPTVEIVEYKLLPSMLGKNYD